MDTTHPLPIALSFSVWFSVRELQALPADEREEVIQRWSRPEIAQHLAEQGDLLLYSSPKTPALFRDLVHALAALSFTEGGVTAFGQHWETTSSVTS